MDKMDEFLVHGSADNKGLSTREFSLVPTNFALTPVVDRTHNRKKTILKSRSPE